MHRLKFLFAFLLPLSAYFSFNFIGWMSFIPMILFYGVVPLAELLLTPDNANWDKKIADDEKRKIIYDWILYLAVPVQLTFLV
jgi:alkane 1-monooxygenase